MKKVQNQLHVWKAKLLSFGGKFVMKNHVLQSMFIYLLSVTMPPKCVFKDLSRTFSKFIWNFKEEGRSKYQVSWPNINLPEAEGGLGFGSLFDV